MTPPEISIVMSVYNGAKYLPEAIGSILSQTFRDFEFIIINDGSTDQSAKLIDDYAASDARIRTVHQTNKGLIASLNHGIALARAPYIARMDDDDISLPHRLETQMNFMKAHPDTGVVGAQIMFVDEQGHALETYKAPNFPILHPKAHYIDNDAHIVAHPATLMRRDLIQKIGGYRDIFKYCEDADLWLRAVKYCNISNCEQVLLKYRRSVNQISNIHCLAQEYGASIAWECHRRVLDGDTDPAEGLLNLPTYDALEPLFGHAAMINIISRCMRRIANSPNDITTQSEAFLNFYIKNAFPRQPLWRYVLKRFQHRQIKTGIKIAERIVF